MGRAEKGFEKLEGSSSYSESDERSGSAVASRTIVLEGIDLGGGFAGQRMGEGAGGMEVQGRNGQ